MFNQFFGIPFAYWKVGVFLPMSKAVCSADNTRIPMGALGINTFLPLGIKAFPPGIWPFLRGGLGGLFPGNRPGRLCRGKMLFRIPWERDVDYTLLRRMIAFNRTEKAHCKTFWRGKA